MMQTAVSRLLIIAGAAGLLIGTGYNGAAAWLIVLGAVVALLIPLDAGPRLPFLRRRRRRSRRTR